MKTKIISNIDRLNEIQKLEYLAITEDYHNNFNAMMQATRVYLDRTSKFSAPATKCVRMCNLDKFNGHGLLINNLKKEYETKEL